MKRLAVFATLFLAMAVTSRADNFVSVNILPVTSDLFNETFGATFLWDTTTNVLSDVDVTMSGSFGSGPVSPDLVFVFGDPKIGLKVIDFSGQPGGVVSLDPSRDNARPIGSTPGTYRTELLFQCFLASCADRGITQQGLFDDAIVTAESPVETPEPGTLLLLGAGLLGFVLIKKL
jgi:hypothetical protein